MTSAIVVWTGGVLFFALAWSNRTSAEMRPKSDLNREKMESKKTRSRWMNAAVAWIKSSRSKILQMTPFRSGASDPGGSLSQTNTPDTELSARQLSNRLEETEQAKASPCTFVIPPWMFWVLIFLVSQPALHAAEKADPA